MKSKRPTKKKPVLPFENRTCGECGRGWWNEENLDYKGERFMIYCVFSIYAYSQRVECGTCFCNTPACPKFIEGEKEKKGGSK